MTIPALLLLLSLASTVQSAQQMYEKTEFTNHSGANWKITLVEGKKQKVGTMRFIDKFSGREAKALTKTGDTFVLTPGSKYVLDFSQGKAYFYQNFIVEDTRGNYAEFISTVPYLTNPQVSLELKGRRVGSPLNRAQEEDITKAIEAALRTDKGDLVIVQNTIGLALNGL